MQVIHEELYCLHCCLHQAVRRDGEVYICTVCQRPIEPPMDPNMCPRSQTGVHNPFRERNAVVCSQCGIQLPAQDHV